MLWKWFGSEMMEVQIKAVAVERSGEKVAARRRVVSQKEICDLLGGREEV